MLKSYVDMISKLAIWERSENVLVAVSGGPDSVCLLRLMDRVAKEMGFFLHIAHLDHQFRGVASQEDSYFVKELAIKLGWPVTVRAFDVPALIEETGQSMQDCSRIVRYRFLKEVAETQGINKVVLGHNKDDQAETILQHLLRGTGMSGLCGMDIIGENKEGLLLIRPLLEITRAEIITILKYMQQPFRTDASNLGDKYQRNHIRHHLVPYLQSQYNPAVIDRLTEMAKILQCDDHYMHKQTALWMKQVVRCEKTRLILNCEKVHGVHQAILMRICREMYRRVVGHSLNLSYQHSKKMREMISDRHGTRISLPGDVYCEKIYAELHVYFRIQAQETRQTLYPVKINGETVLPDGSKLLTKIITSKEIIWPLNKETCLLDLDKVGYELFVRYRRPGDLFKALGSLGHKKLKVFFINQKVPHYKRDDLPLLVNEADLILWIISHRPSEYGKITSRTKNILWCYHTGGTENA